MTVTSVPILVLKLLLNMFSQGFTAVCAPSVVIGRCQVPEFCRHRSTPKRLQLINENQRICIEKVREPLQPKQEFSFWRHFPGARDIVWTSNTAVVDKTTAEAKEVDSKIIHEIPKPGIETATEIILDDGLYNLYEYPVKTVEANPEEMHTYL